MLNPLPETPAPRPLLPIGGPLSLGELLDRAFRLYRLRFRGFLTIAAVFLVPYAIVSGLLTGSVMADSFSLLSSLVTNPQAMPDPALLESMLTGFGSLFGLSLLLSVVGLAVQLLNTLALTSHSIAALYGRPEPVRASLRTATRRFWTAVGMSLLRVLAFLGIALALAIAIAISVGVLTIAAGGLFSFMETQGELAAYSMIGVFGLLMCAYIFAALLLMGPMVYLMARWQVALPGIVDQKWGARQSLRASWRLSRGHTLRVIGYLLLLWILSVVITTVPLTIVQYVALFMISNPQSLVLVSAASGAFSTLLYVFWQPLAANAVALLYFDLRVRQEGLDIEQRVAALAAEMGPAGLPAEAPGDAIS